MKMTCFACTPPTIYYEGPGMPTAAADSLYKRHWTRTHPDGSPPGSGLTVAEYEHYRRTQTLPPR